ncbi:MAG: cupin domain-containing protein [Deltaproteobacteria bacterium]|nr:cupin domain-containing protein [Deltaproteobacteria bacterium]
MPKVDVQAAPRRMGSKYPAPFDAPCAERVRTRLGDAGGLTQFGVNLLELPPGAWSSQRHWHSDEDELVYVLAGEVTLVTNDGEHVLRAGDCAAFPKGDANGHQLINRSASVARVIEVGGRSEVDVCRYPDIDLEIDARVGQFTHRDGTPYPET